jgi:hypothetical protein
MISMEYSKPGRYSVLIPVEPPESFTLVIGMTNDHGQYFEDALPVSVGTRFYVWIKFMVAAPVGLLCLPLLLITKHRK